ncbi:AAA family ATPase [Aeromonas salmonicida]|uniref:AAA family ATPase n=1 Tax=Aeromonas salmonicida TaxID=645 RepID=UPI00240E8C9E|nr:AAA family ATPase [Aeromonas salmonicida]WFC12376.1 AAA family ATPase [Aeromonas salmonicida]
MLERIHWVKGVGLLHDADGRQYGLKKASLIYADNGVGKSTLASIFRSCASNDPDLITRRRTIDGNNQPEVHFQFSNGQNSRFTNSTWDHPRSELLVFDADFVEKNVYAGGQVTTDQRRNLLQFALGTNAVNAQHEYDQADADAVSVTQRVRDLNNQLAGFHRGIPLRQFRDLVEVADADAQIARLNEQIVEAQNIGLIQAKALPRLLEEPTLNVAQIFETFRRSLTDIDLAAEQCVRQHLDLQNQPGLEKWISDGHNYGNDENCPYCNQPLDGVELIGAYRSYFNQDYNRLKASVAELDTLILNATSESIAERLVANFSTASAIIDGWQEHLEIQAPEFDSDAAMFALLEIRRRLEALRSSKEANLLEPVGSIEAENELGVIWEQILVIVRSCNSGIDAAIRQIDVYKANLATVNADDLRRQIASLELVKTRYRQEVVDMLSQLDTALSQEAVKQAEKQLKKDALNTTMQATLERYKDRINQLLRAFGAQFSIPNIDFNYRGGLRSNYNLYMRGANIELTGGVPDFKTSLSEGDKRTLAFAFFIASVESTVDLASKVVVIDDPMCSLDLNRKQQTRTILKRVHDNCEQLIVLVHDIHFMRSLRDEILRGSTPQHVVCLKLKTVANRYSDFDVVDVDKACESAYFKCHRVLDEYLNGMAQSSMEVARSIRPMLEGYLHRRFPSKVDSGLLFGQVIQAINAAPQNTPLFHAQNITAELNEINGYAGQFHHDTNPSADQVQIIDGELRQFVERAIRIVHSGIA